MELLFGLEPFALSTESKPNIPNSFKFFRRFFGIFRVTDVPEILRISGLGTFYASRNFGK